MGAYHPSAGEAEKGAFWLISIPYLASLKLRDLVSKEGDCVPDGPQRLSSCPTCIHRHTCIGEKATSDACLYSHHWGEIEAGRSL